MSGPSFLSVPELDAQPRLQADWLELAAFFSPRREVLITELVNQQDLEWDQEPEDFGDTAELLEDIHGKVIQEVERRRHDLDKAYPFEIDEAGQVFSLVEDWNFGQAVYLFCLILSHSPSSELVPEEYAPAKDKLRAARDLFQVCSTLAASGHTRGPAFSVGWPRVDASRFLEKLHAIWQIYGDGTPHDEPPPGAPEQVKDDEIDVISYWPESDKRPGHGFLLGQVASGNDWRKKSIQAALGRFKFWFKHQPAAPAHGAIFTPFYVEDESISRDTMYFGYVAHRLRLPMLAWRTENLVTQGVTPIERLEDSGRVLDWLTQHRQHILGSLQS